jgi:hypothetical protein
LRLLYEWAEKKGHIARSPVLVHAVRLRYGSTAMAADQAPRDVRCSDVKWVTPRTYRLWLQVGLLGYDTAGQPDLSWRGRNDGRNAAFTDLLFSSGLPLREGGCLLTLEVPDAAAGQCYYEGSVAGAVAKRRERMFYASAVALQRVAGYIATTRAEAIRRARRHHRYDQMPGKLIVTRVSHGARRKLCWRDEQGQTGEAPVGAIGPAERMRLFTETGHGLEPLWLWLTEGGTPMAYPSWEKVFDAANARVAAVFAAAARQDGRRRTAIACSPHMMRHSFALYMQRRGVASNATFRVWRKDGAVRDGSPSPAGRRSRRQSEAAVQEGRDRTVLRQLQASCIHSGCIRRKHDAAKVTKKRSDEDRCHYRPIVTLTHSAGLVIRSLPVWWRCITRWTAGSG